MPLREGQHADFDPDWELHPVRDDSDRRRAARTASHIVREVDEACSWPRFPSGAIPFVSNGTADRLVLASDSDDLLYWDHEEGGTFGVRVGWD